MTNNKLELKKPLAFFDLETTGVDVAKDRIVEISIVKLHPDGTQQILTKRVNPTIPIPPEVTAIHGITDDDVKDKPTFKELANEINSFMDGCDLAGYNIIRFDVPLLVEEMLRAGISHFPPNSTRFVDAMSIFHHFEKRDLASALKYYCNKDLTDAHSAEADTLATVDILKAQVERYDLDSDIDQLQEISTHGREIIDYAGKFTRNEYGDIVFTFGKNKGKKVIDDPDYVDWMCNKDFTFDTKKKAKLIVNGDLN